ncbi:hypothetical protein FKW77_006010 [Venturia effusa]|uniref:Uncharacterized protein n=1 Tax=Venturia effusa TaxID=50376 RepID=A0A517KZI9_9PEZI|nr:hypothetical protein FKW77_006010 [Venturia effusa]
MPTSQSSSVQPTAISSMNSETNIPGPVADSTSLSAVSESLVSSSAHDSDFDDAYNSSSATISAFSSFSPTPSSDSLGSEISSSSSSMSSDSHISSSSVLHNDDSDDVRSTVSSQISSALNSSGSQVPSSSQSNMISSPSVVTSAPDIISSVIPVASYSEHDDGSESHPIITPTPTPTSESLPAEFSISSNGDPSSVDPLVTSSGSLSSVIHLVSPSQTEPPNGPTVTPRESTPVAVPTTASSESFQAFSSSSAHDHSDFPGSSTSAAPATSPSAISAVVDNTVPAVPSSTSALTSGANIPSISPAGSQAISNDPTDIQTGSLTAKPTNSGQGTTASSSAFPSISEMNVPGIVNTSNETVSSIFPSLDPITAISMRSASSSETPRQTASGSLAMGSSVSISSPTSSPSDTNGFRPALIMITPSGPDHTSTQLGPSIGLLSDPVPTPGQPRPPGQASHSLSGSPPRPVQSLGAQDGHASQPQPSRQASGVPSGPSQEQSSSGERHHETYDYEFGATDAGLTTSTIYSTISNVVTSAQFTKVITSVVAVSTTILPVNFVASKKESGTAPVISNESTYDQVEDEKQHGPSTGRWPSGFAFAASTMSTANGPKKTRSAASIATPSASINTNTLTSLTHGSCIPTTTTVYVYATATSNLGKRGLEKRDMGHFDYTSPNVPVVTSTTHTETQTATVTPSPSGTTTTTNMVYATTTDVITPLPSGTTTTTLDPSGTYTAWTTTTVDATLSIYTNYEEATTSTTSTPTSGVATLTEYDTATVTTTLTFTEVASETVVTTITACWPEGAYDHDSFPSGAALTSSSEAVSSSTAPAADSSSAAPPP